MSTIQITDDLLNGIQQVLQSHDNQTKDAGVAVQYLAAVVGLMVAHFPAETQNKKQIMAQLCDFANHVLDENTNREEANPAHNEAFGIWKPEQNR
jgi:hypothetical protein